MAPERASLTYEAFKQQWQQSGELDSDIVLAVAWRRYQHVQSEGYVPIPESEHPSLNQLEAAFDPLFNHKGIREMWSETRYLTLPANTIPWTRTGIFVDGEEAITILATGRTWRSKLLDLYLPPQFNLWYRIGVNGTIFNSTHDTRTFRASDGQKGELFVANQFPGSFHEKHGGRVGGNLSVYDRAEGAFQLCIIQWRPGTHIVEDIMPAMKSLLYLSHNLARLGEATQADPYKLLSTGVNRLASDYFVHSFPAGWTLLWFLGVSEIFFEEQVEESEEAAKLQVPSSGKLIRCLPNKNVGILQKDLAPPVLLSSSTTATWSWNITDLPSRLREDTTLSHDYLSLAFEFENGRDLTYTWSWELPIGFGYWCPLAAWCDREYHVVIRSGTAELGQWLTERRNIYQDYVQHVNAGDDQQAVPQQIVRVWLIAGNRWQRHRGEMLIKDICLLHEESEPTIVL